MIFIGENIHVISKSVREALINHDENFLKNLIKLQTKMDYTDLNAGPASGELKGILSWLCPVVEQNSGLKISLDTTNFEEMKSAFNFIKNKEDVFLNSASNDLKKLDHAVLLVNVPKSNFCIFYKNKDLKNIIVIDPWLGFAVYANNAVVRYNSEFAGFLGLGKKYVPIHFDVHPNPEISQQTVDYMKKTYPQFIQKKGFMKTV